MGYDPAGTWTLTVGFSLNLTAFLGYSISVGFTIDDKGTIEVQGSKTDFSDSETTGIGLVSVGASINVQLTNKENAEDLRGTSTYIGGNTPVGGVDIVIDKPIAADDGEICGVQFSIGPSVGVDVHAIQAKTKALFRFDWRIGNKWTLKKR